MSNPETIEEKPISLAEVKEEVEKIKKRDKELSFRTAKTEEYINQFAKKESLKLVETLKKMEIARLKEEHIAKIADILPKTVEDLKVVLQGYTITITKENMSKIVEEVNKIA